MNFSSGTTRANMPQRSALGSSDSNSGEQTSPSMPTLRAIAAAVVAESPVTMTVRTPNSRSSLISLAESSRGGSLMAIRPTSRRAFDEPKATAITR